MKKTHVIVWTLFCVSQAQAFTFAKHPTKSYECDVCSTLSHEILQDKWELSNESLHENVSNLQKSYAYKERVTSKQLRKGVVISTLAPGAVIRITPIQNKSLPQLNIETPTHQSMSLKDASNLYSKDDRTRNSLLATRYQVMLQMKPELGAGKFIIRSDKLAADNTDFYMINVFDKFSSTHLDISTKTLHYQYGDHVVAKINLQDDDTNYSIEDIDVSLVGPSGQILPMKITKKEDNIFEASTVLSSEVNDHGENWYIEANVETEFEDKVIKRNAHTAFSYSIPSAKLVNVVKLSSNPLTFVATVNVATASRYALQGVLYKDSAGQIKPTETAQKAQWLEPGTRLIQFTFDNSSQLEDDNLYLGYLRLIDYGQLKMVDHYNPPIKLTQLVE